MAATLNLPTIVVRMMLNANQYLNAMNRVQTANNQLQQQTATRAVALNVARNIIAPLALIGTVAVREFAKFDRAMTESLSIMGSVAPEMRKQMEDFAMSMSTTTITSAEDLARSYYFLAQSGLDLQGVMAGLPVVNQFAIAGMFDQKKATDILTDAQSALGLNIANNAAANAAAMEHLGDVLVKASTIANSSVEQFSTALTSKAGAALKFFRIPVEQGMGALAAFADQGVRAELAGNSLDRGLRLLAKSALSHGHVWKMLNFEIYDANGNWRDLADVMENLEQVMRGLSAEQRAAALSMMGFDARSQQAITPLIGMSEAMREYTKQLNAATGTTSNVAKAVQSSFWSEMVTTWNQLRAVAIDIGKILVPALQSLNVLLKASLAAWLSLSDGTKKFLVYGTMLAALTVSLAAMLPIVQSLGAAFAGLSVGAQGIITLTAGFAGLVAVLAGLPGLILAIERETSGLNDAIKEQMRLNDLMITQQQLKMNKGVDEANKMLTPEKRKEQLDKQIAALEPNLKGVQDQRAGAAKRIQEYRDSRSMLGNAAAARHGDDMEVVLQREAAEVRKKEMQLRGHMERLQKERARAEKEINDKQHPGQNAVKQMEDAGILKPGDADKMSGQELKDALKKWEDSIGKAKTSIDSIKEKLQEVGGSIVDGVKGAVQFGEDAADVVNREMDRIRKTKELDEKMAENARDEQERRDNLYMNNYNETKGSLGPARSASDVFRKDIMGSLPDVIRNKQIGLPGFMNQQDNPEIRQARKEEKERREKFDREKEQLEIQKQQLAALQTIAGNSQTNNVVGAVGKFAKGLLGL